ncbi:MAG: glycoside hydrolase family 3 N-terminal domain-containing protein [bacterium]
MPADKQTFIDNLIRKMTLDEKIGCCITFGFNGSQVDQAARDAVFKYHCAGFRLTPHVSNVQKYQKEVSNAMEYRVSTYLTPPQYTELLNELQDMALSRPTGIPLHISNDQEGDLSQDYARGGVHLFPSAMGLTAANDPELVYEACRAIARQQRAAGIHWLHTPCVDVNVNPKNPEICTRSFSDDPEKCAEYGIIMMKAFMDENLIPLGKHFPGRGDSAVDVHYDLDVNNHDRERLDMIELYPYKKMIEQGLPAIMTAHHIFPALDPSGMPASVSRKINTDLLRNEMGFKGVITTDSIGMGGLMKKVGTYGNACGEAIRAGADLVLAKARPEQQQEAFDGIKQYVEDGKIPINELEEHVKRVLALKWDFGHFKNPKTDSNGAMAPILDSKVKTTSYSTAQKCAILVRDTQNILPLKPDQKILVTEQFYPVFHYKAEDYWWHSNMFHKFIREHAKEVYDVETGLTLTEEDERNVMEYADKVDVVVVLSFFWRGNPTNTGLVKKLLKTGKKVVLVTNTPYKNICIDEAPALLITFGIVPPCLKNAADVLYGRGETGGTWPLKDYHL